MGELNKEAQKFIKTYLAEHIGLEGMLALQSLSMRASAGRSFAEHKCGQVIDLLQKSYYVNEVLVWKLAALIGERRQIQAQFQRLCDRWEAIETQINISNSLSLNSRVETQVVSVMSAIAQPLTTVTRLKDGKLKLQTGPIKRVFAKLRRENEERLLFHHLVASELEKFIMDNAISDFIKSEIRSHLVCLSGDLAHDPKFSAKNGGDTLSSSQPGVADVYSVYPPIPVDVKPSDSIIKIADYFLFNDLRQIRQWMSRC